MLPPVLRDYAGLEKKVLMVGQSNKFEIWAESTWESRREEWLSDEAGKLDQLPDELKTFNL